MQIYHMQIEDSTHEGILSQLYFCTPCHELGDLMHFYLDVDILVKSGCLLLGAEKI